MNFDIDGGSVPGREHIGAGGMILGVNNQDAFGVEEIFDLGGRPLIAGVVCDGCSSSPRSEVGSNWAVQAILESVSRHGGLEGGHWPQLVGNDLIRKMIQVASATVGHDPESICRFITDNMMFTVYGFVVGEEWTTIYGCGDGVHAVNGNITVVGPYTPNYPPYIAYEALSRFQTWSGHEKLQKWLADRRKGDWYDTMRVREMIPTSAVDTLLIGSDGMTDLIGRESEMDPSGKTKLGLLSQFWEDQFGRVGTRLRAMNRERTSMNPEGGLTRAAGPFNDDATLVVIRRRKEDAAL